MRYQIRQLTLGGILDQAITLMKDHFSAFLKIVGVTLVPFLLANTFFNLTMIPQPASLIPTQDELAAMQAAQQKHLPVVMLLSVVAMIASVLSNAAIVQGIASAYLGKPVSTGESVSRALKAFFPLIGTSILMGLAIMGGFILLIIPGILFAFWFALATQVVVIEHVSGISALKRSKSLMKGNIGTLFVMGIVLGLINSLIGAGVGFIPQPHARAVGLVVVQSLLTVFGSAAVVVFYFSCRCRNEQFDLQLLAENLGAEPVLETLDEQGQS